MLYSPHDHRQAEAAKLVRGTLSEERIIICFYPRLTLLALAHTTLLQEKCVLASTTQKEALESLGETKPTLLFCSDTLEQGDGISLIRQVKSAHSEIKTLLFTDRDHPGVISDALDAGTDGVVPTSLMGAGIFGEAIIAITRGGVFYPESVREAVKEPTRGGEKLHLLSEMTDREKEVLELVAEGCSNNEISERLVISLATCKSHISALTGKLQVSSRTQLAVLAIRKGLVA